MHYEVFQIDGAIQLNIEGKLDATSGNAFQALVLKSLSKCRNLVIDFERYYDAQSPSSLGRG